MKQKRICMLVLFVSSMWAGSFAYGVVTDAPYDFSSPEATFRSCGQAITNNDPQTFYKAIGGIKVGPYEEFLNKVWKYKDVKGTENSLALSTAVTRTGKVAGYFMEAEFLQQKDREVEKEGEMRTYWVKWKPGNLIRMETFARSSENTSWIYCLNPWAHTKDRTARDSYGTPSDAYCSIGQAIEMRLIRELCRGLASAVRGGVDIDRSADTLRKRLAKLPEYNVDQVWRKSMLGGLAGGLEEEMVSATNDVTMCRVWFLDKDAHGKSKRRDFQLFAKEGDEWKWIPDEKSFWHPKNWQTADKPLTNTPTGKAPSSRP